MLSIIWRFRDLFTKENMPTTTVTFPFSCQQGSIAKQQETQKGSQQLTKSREFLRDTAAFFFFFLKKGYLLPCAQSPHGQQRRSHQRVPTEKTVTAQSPFHKTNNSSKSGPSPRAGLYPTAAALRMLGNNLIIGQRRQKAPDVSGFAHSWTRASEERTWLQWNI